MKLDLSPVALGQPAVTATFENTTSVRLVAIVEALDEWGPWRERIAACCERLASLSEADWFLVADSAAAPAFPFMDGYVIPAKARMFNELMRQIDKRLNGAGPAWVAGWYMLEKNPYRFIEFQNVLDELRETLGDEQYVQMFDGEPKLRLPRHLYTAGDLAELLTAEAIKAQAFAEFVSHDLVARLALSLDAVARVFPELEIERTQREPVACSAGPSAACAAPVEPAAVDPTPAHKRGDVDNMKRAVGRVRDLEEGRTRVPGVRIQVAGEFGVNVRTLAKWIKRVDEMDAAARRRAAFDAGFSRLAVVAQGE